MIIGTVTCDNPPAQMTILKKDRITASQLTYTDVAFFSWGVTIIGKPIELLFPAMTITEFNLHQAQYEADAQVVFNPEDGSGKTYNVEIADFDGKYFLDLNSSGAGHRINVEITLLIMSEVSP